ncbi:hypothetical protein P43SY_009198 [Pythium insidiosum]|uniref:Uncharacterized protein n=1 Tax=Pythium insidiosum TaxID=114742 RepID=A0AAD5M815_PYTIN|nr:hypothetical protein P43SY_009198 [Pythium insidiosum]
MATASDGVGYLHLVNTLMISTSARWLRRVSSRVGSAWDAAQVELHGFYSVQRMQDLQAYMRDSSSRRVVAIALFTPLPCLLAVAIADSIPLQPIETPINDASGFWIRATFATWVYTYSMLEQLRLFVAAMPLSPRASFLLSLPVTVLTNSATYLFGLAVGFPVPFTLPMLSVPWFGFMAGAIWLYLRRFFAAHPEARKAAFQFTQIMCCQVSLVLVYPAYNALFTQLPPTGQLLLVTLLPLIKMVERNLISFFLRHLDDLKPQTIIFNVEVFNALFIACCMQSSASVATNVLLVAVDVAMASISLRDLDRMLDDLQRLAAKINIDRDQLLDVALQISRENPSAEQQIVTRFETLRRSRSRLRSRRWTTALWRWLGLGRDSVAPTPPLSPAPRVSQILPTPDPQPKRALDLPIAWMDPPPVALLLSPDALSDGERVLFLQRVLQVLHLTEYLLLIEFIEVAIPIVYSTYLVVLFYLPNRVYYPQLRDMDGAHLSRTIGYVMMNAACEGVSLVVLSSILRRKLRIRPARQLAFALDAQHRLVQSRLILWVVVTLQSSLDHLGADYSFRFDAMVAASGRKGVHSLAQLKEIAAATPVPAVRELLLGSDGPPTELLDEHGAMLLRVLSAPLVAPVLSAVDLSFNDLSDAFWTPLETAPDSNSGVLWPQLTTLNLSNNRFTIQSLPALTRLVARAPTLLHLDVSLNAELLASDAAVSTLLSPLSGLQTLELSCLHLTDTSVDSLLQTTLTSTLRQLFLRNNDLSDAAAVAIADALPRLRRLHVLSLSGNRITDSGLAALTFELDRAPALQTLDVGANLISDVGLQTLVRVIHGWERPFPLRYLHLDRNDRVRNDALRALVQRALYDKVLETFVLAHATTERLGLNGKMLKRTLQLGSVLTDHFVRVALATVRLDNRWAALRELDLSHNAIDRAGACELGVFLSLLPALRVLNLAHNTIDDVGVGSLADGLEDNPTLEELDLTHNCITDDGARRLYLKAFTSNLQRRLLLSDGNPLTSECKVMVAAISQAYDLRQRFAREFAPRERLDLVNMELRQYGAAAIVECLLASVATARCTTLDISHNALGDEGAVEMARLLRGYPALTRLDLSFNDIGDEGAAALADALQVNTTLTALSLHSRIAGSVAPSPLSDRGLGALAEALERHPAITTLDLRDNVTPSALVPRIVRMLQRNSRIQRFNGSSAAVFLARHEP